MLMGSLIIHVLLVLAGTRLAMYCVMEWKLLRIKRTVASAAVSRWDRFLLVVLPVVALLMVGLVINSGITVVRLFTLPLGA
jgi:hypothetical protein